MTVSNKVRGMDKDFRPRPDKECDRNPKPELKQILGQYWNEPKPKQLKTGQDQIENHKFQRSEVRNKMSR